MRLSELKNKNEKQTQEVIRKKINLEPVKNNDDQEPEEKKSPAIFRGVRG